MLLDLLQAKVGDEGSVVVFLDACYSGTGTRGPADRRLGSWPLRSAEADSESIVAEPEPDFVFDQSLPDEFDD